MKEEEEGGGEEREESPQGGGGGFSFSHSTNENDELPIVGRLMACRGALEACVQPSTVRGTNRDETRVSSR